ncbi:MAG: hypothetical protein DWQ31_16585 [Planctomycetota bacterium]|nr:MAG: hypothetical protein DWQ31_16585 [Planctomycetota bacterium]
MPTVEFDLRGAGKIPAEHKAIGDAAEASARKQTKLGQTWNATASEAKKYDQLAQKIIRDNETAQERYNRKLAETKKALAGNAREQELLAKETARLKKELKESQQSSEKLFGEGTIKKIASIATGYLSLQSALRLITQEMQKQQEFVDKRAAAQLSVSESRNLVLRNVVSKTPAEREAILANSQRLASETGVSETAINAGLAQALSASGGKVSASLEATKIASRFLVDRPSEIGEFAGTLLDLSKITQTDDALTNLGLLSRVGELGRVVDPGLQARNIAPALIGFQTTGGTGREAGALYAALSNAGADVRGERTGTSLIQLGEQLRDFLSEDDTAKDLAAAQEKRKNAVEAIAKAEERLASAKTAEAELEERLAARSPAKTAAARRTREVSDAQARDRAARAIESARSGVTTSKQELSDVDATIATLTASSSEQANLRKQFEGLTTGQKIKFLQDNPELAQAFLGDASFEAKSKGVIRDLLLTPTSNAAQEYRKNLGLIPDNAGLATAGQAALEVFQSNTLEPVAAGDRAIDQTLESLRTRNGVRSLTSEQREKVQEISVLAGQSAVGAYFDDYFGGFGDGVAGISTERAIDNLLYRRATLGGGRRRNVSGTSVLTPIPTEELSPDDQFTAKKIDDLIAELRKQTKSLDDIKNNSSEGGLRGVAQ